MRRAFLLSVAGAALLAGCAPLAAVVGPNPVTPAADEPTVLKADYGVERFYNVAATSYLKVEAGLSASNKASAKAILAKMYTATLAAQTAVSAGDDTTLNARIADLTSLSAQVTAIIGKPAA